MAITIETPMRFTRRARVSGQFNANFVFETDAALSEWQAHELPQLETKYGPLSLTTSSLPGLAVGDTCRVIGEGDTEFVIEQLVCYSPNHYGFALDSGWTEEVAKCYR